MFDDVNRNFWIEFENDPKSFISLGLVKEDYLPAFSQVVEDSRKLGLSDVSLKLRKQGAFLERDELKTLGLSANVKMGKAYVAGLTNKGLASPLETANLLCYANLILKGKSDTLINIGVPRIPITVKIVSSKNVGWNCCKKAIEVSNQRFDVKKAPRLPLANCDKWCGCVYTFERRN